MYCRHIVRTSVHNLVTDSAERRVRSHQSEAKTCLREQGADVPRGFIATAPDEVAECVLRVWLPAVRKAQVAAGGCEKSGLVKHVDTTDDALTSIKGTLSAGAQCQHVSPTGRRQFPGRRTTSPRTHH